MSYTAEFIKDAMPLIFDPTATVQVTREQGMPTQKKDPRASVNGLISMIDVRRCWEQCEWLSFEHRQAVLAAALCGTYEAAGVATGKEGSTILRRESRALDLMAEWLNSSYAQREEWDYRMEAEAKGYKLLEPDDD